MPLCYMQAAVQRQAQQAIGRLSPQTKGQAYQAWLGYYNTYRRKLQWSEADLVQAANHFATTIGKQ